MESIPLERRARGNRRGAVLLIMVLIVVLAGILLVYDPFSFFGSRGGDLPWNQLDRIVMHGKTVPAPSTEQPSIIKMLSFRADAMLEDEGRGKIEMLIQPDGRVVGEWGAEYEPKPGIHYQVVKSRFRGNIDSSRMYKDEYGEDPSRLFFITHGKLMIMETNSETRKIRMVKGHIYVRGWLDTEYNATGEIIITSDRKSYKSFSWEAKGRRSIFELFK
ncbi:MAG: hypothetical protein ACYSR5_12105 [Planctomycetota bacterium]